MFGSVLEVAAPFVLFAQLATDRLVGVLGGTALARLADRLGDRAATGADLAHAARLCDRLRKRRWCRRGGALARALRCLCLLLGLLRRCRRDLGAAKETFARAADAAL